MNLIRKNRYDNHATDETTRQTITAKASMIASPITDFALRAAARRLWQQRFKPLMVLALICAMTVSSFSYTLTAQVRADDPSLAALLLLIREAQDAASDKDVKDELKAVRQLIGKARESKQRDTENASLIIFMEARDKLRRLIDAPRESADVQEKIANVLKALQESFVSPDQGGGPHTALTETAFGLHTATFDTLQGTVTVNLPDDMAAGDNISGSVIAEAKGKTPEEREQNQDQLSGMVVELDKQPQPADNQIAKWVVPAGLAAIPLILKNSEGKEIARTQVPASIPTPQEPFRPTQGEVIKDKKPGEASSNKPYDNKNAAPLPVDPPQGYQTPALAQAGKPVEVKGKFDGDAKSTVVSIANRAVKILAESPRKVIAQTPANVLGSAPIEVQKKGVTVARCVYRSVGIRLSAAKLNLTRGEQTTMTVTVLGLDNGASSANSRNEAAARVRLVNQSPWVIRMEGGESQSFAVNAAEMKNGAYTTTRTLTGLKAGGFAINATVEPGAAKSRCDESEPISAGPPQPDTGRQRPDNSSTTVNQNAANAARPITQPVGQTNPDVDRNNVDRNGEPRSGSESRPVESLRGTFRVTLNGFRADRQTRDSVLELDGVGDEVTLINHIGVVDNTGRLQRLTWGNIFSSFMGQRPRNEIQAGRGSERGGIITGDGFPTRTPWIRGSALNPNIPPNALFEGELTQGVNAALIIPTIWEVDGPSALQTEYANAMDRDAANITRAVAGMITARSTGARSFLRAGEALGVGNTATLQQRFGGIGGENNRPVGMKELRGAAFGEDYGFTPQALVLTYDLALLVERTDLGFGRGVIPVRYTDDPRLEGDYTLFIRVERIDSGRPASPECADIEAVFAGRATLTILHEFTPEPFIRDVSLRIAFSECRTIVTVVDFPPISTEPFNVGPLGLNVTTVTRESGGTGRYDSRTGQLDLDITLRFSHSVRSPLARPSDLPLTLSTAPPNGRPFRMGRGTLFGSGRFRGGFLDGTEARISITGELSPNP